MGHNFKQEPEYIVLKSHEENGITIIDECKITGISIIEEESIND